MPKKEHFAAPFPQPRRRLQKELYLKFERYSTVSVRSPPSFNCTELIGEDRAPSDLCVIPSECCFLENTAAPRNPAPAFFLCWSVYILLHLTTTVDLVDFKATRDGTLLPYSKICQQQSKLTNKGTKKFSVALSLFPLTNLRVSCTRGENNPLPPQAPSSFPHILELREASLKNGASTLTSLT